MAIPQIEELDLLHANICQALGDPKRIQILYALHGEPRYVSALADALGMPQPTVSRHYRCCVSGRWCSLSGMGKQ